VALVDRRLRSVLPRGFVKPGTILLQAALKQRIRFMLKSFLKGELIRGKSLRFVRQSEVPLNAFYPPPIEH
jgi:hypothetical protein